MQVARAHVRSQRKAETVLKPWAAAWGSIGPTSAFERTSLATWVGTPPLPQHDSFSDRLYFARFSAPSLLADSSAMVGTRQAGSGSKRKRGEPTKLNDAATIPVPAATRALGPKASRTLHLQSGHARSLPLPPLCAPRAIRS